MSVHNRELQELRGKLMQKAHIQSKLAALNQQLADVQENVKLLERNKFKEEKDVESLMKGNIQGFFLELVGRKEEKLSKEKEEAYKAAMKYNMELQVLDSLERDIRYMEEQLSDMEACEERYQRLYQQEIQSICAGGGARAEELKALESELYETEAREKELAEAIDAGNQAYTQADAILKSLHEAEDWCTWDVLGGGIVADLAKHEKLEEASGQLQVLQSLLHNFHAELSDVNVDMGVSLEMGEFLKFADYFFDNIFSDWAVKSKVDESLEKMERVSEEIDELVQDLKQKLEEARREKEELLGRRDELVV